MGRFLHWVRAWLTDGLRLAGGLPYWNLRKSFFLLRGRRGNNPCQNPSDPDVAGSIRCEACLHWEQPARFRRVCPLLSKRDGEWRCAAGRDDVRPFWDRALLGWIAGPALLYLAGTLLVFGILRITAAPTLAWHHVIWPGGWAEIPRAQARHFFQQASVAFAANQPQEAYLALVTAHNLDPNDYETALLLAQLTMYQRSYVFADESFRDLLARFSAQRMRTAITYHDSLLALFRYDALAEFSLMMALADQRDPSLWVQSLLQALQRSGRAEVFVRERGKQMAGLPPPARRLLDAELAVERGDLDDARALLARPQDGALHLFYMQEQVGRLARLGATDEAQVLLNYYGAAMGDFPSLLAQLDLDFLIPGDWQAPLDFRRLLRLPLQPGQVERMIALLVTHPRPVYYRQLDTYLRERPALAAKVSGAAMWVAGLACGATAEAEHWQTAGHQQPGASYPRITAVNFDSRRLDDADSVPRLINTLALPREVIAALQARAVARARGGP